MAGQRNDYGKRIHSQSEYSANEGSKRRNPNEEKESNAMGLEDTVYRYLCPLRRIGSIIGVGGDIAKQLRAETHAKIRISEMIPGCEERVVTIYSSREGTNSFGDDGDLISPAQDALFKVSSTLKWQNELAKHQTKTMGMEHRNTRIVHRLSCLVSTNYEMQAAIRVIIRTRIHSTSFHRLMSK